MSGHAGRCTECEARNCSIPRDSQFVQGKPDVARPAIPLAACYLLLISQLVGSPAIAILAVAREPNPVD